MMKPPPRAVMSMVHRPPAATGGPMALLRCCRRALSSSRYGEKRSQKSKELEEFAEVRAVRAFSEQLRTGTCIDRHAYHGAMPALLDVASGEEVRQALRAGFATFCLHAEARVAASMGEGFYTIGPCGEELLSAVGLALAPSDPAALHYRHLATQIARHARQHEGLAFDNAAALEPLLLDRARGYVLSSLDPVTGGAHCALGGGERDFLVTSTLASQASPAVGRALAPGIIGQLRGEKGARRREGGGGIVSYVSVGDGSVNNGHFLSAANIAAYAAHRGFKCPVLFGISDNDLCISLKGVPGWLDSFCSRLGFRVFACDGTSLSDVFRASKAAVAATRSSGKPAALVFKHLPRRFGHAATDRQAAYLAPEEIAALENSNPLESACAAAVAEGIADFPTLAALFDEVQAMTEQSFAAAAEEPKLESLGLGNLVSRNYSAPAPLAAHTLRDLQRSAIATAPLSPGGEKGGGRKEVLRKHMNRAIGESLEDNPDMVYVGEDVEHGGYYLVTEGLAKKFPGRVRDMPPDETSLVGVCHGLAQSGLVVVCEIPYAKYLDCGMDMFSEVVVSGWLNRKNQTVTGGAEGMAEEAGGKGCGMIVRLQGFDRGLFGGNFHTHNALPLLPGLDVIVHSNGADWVKGWRYAVRQAKAGRVVMIVDSTDLLNRRHVNDGDGAMLLPYPPAPEELAFDVVIRHDHSSPEQPDDLTIVTYGNGVVAARRAQQALKASHGAEVGILEVPCVSQVPLETLAAAIAAAGGGGGGDDAQPVLFADVCKANQAPLNHFAVELSNAGVVGCRVGGAGRDWALVAAPQTYNPLGSTATFLNESDVTEAARSLLGPRG